MRRLLRVLMPKPRAQFAEVWTRKLWRDWRKHLHQDQADAWCEELADCHAGSWHRMIVLEWGGERFLKTQQAFEIARWLQNACEHKLFVSPRGRSDISLGVQIWCSNRDDLAVISMMATKVVQVREFDHSEFVTHMKMILNWMVK